MNTNKFYGLMIGCSAAAMLLAGTAHAVVLTDTGTCGNVSITPDYNACLGFFAGNDRQQQDDVIDTMNHYWGPSWALLADSKAEAGSLPTPWTNAFFSVSSSTEYKTGTVTFTNSFMATYGTGYDVVFSFKAGNEFSLYRWDADVADAIAPSNAFGFETPYSALSHGQLWLRQTAVVSEPASLAMFGLGLIGLGMARRRASR